jgi:DNA replication factor GINS
MSKNSDPLSFEDLGAIYRTEKKSPTLSTVRKDLYSAMAGLIIDLRSEYEKHLSKDPDSIICEGVNQRRKKAVSMSREITELRMGKIAALALIGARGGQNVLNNLTPEEREYYDDVLNVSRRHIGIMDRLSGKRKFETPEIDRPATKEKEPEPAPVRTEQKAEKPEDVPVPVAVKDDVQEYAPLPEPAAEEPPKEKAESPKEESPEEELVVIRILEDLPPFSGPDRNYELSKEDIVRMPKTMALALINRDKAVLLNPGP